MYTISINIKGGIFRKILGKSFVCCMVVLSLVPAGSALANESSIDKEAVTTLSYAPNRIHYYEENPFDFDSSKWISKYENGYLYQGTVQKAGKVGWLFKYSGYLYRTPIATNSLPTKAE